MDQHSDSPQLDQGVPSSHRITQAGHDNGTGTMVSQQAVPDHWELADTDVFQAGSAVLALNKCHRFTHSASQSSQQKNGQIYECNIRYQSGD